MHDFKTLRTVIRELIVESSKAQKKFTTKEGDIVDFGSKKHVRDLERTLTDIVAMRNRQHRTSKSRYILSRAVEEIRKQLKKAKSYGFKNGLLSEV